MNNVQNNKVSLPPISNILRESGPVYQQGYEGSFPRYEVGPPPPMDGRFGSYQGPKYGSRFEMGARYEALPRYEGTTYAVSPRFAISPRYEPSRLPVSPRYETSSQYPPRYEGAARPSFDTTPRYGGPSYERPRAVSSEPTGPISGMIPTSFKSDESKCHSKTASDAGVCKRKTRNNLPKETTYILINWLNDHLNHPYPNSFEKNQLMIATGLNHQQ
mmetsp:Transcript_6638/g.6538  ORF Transcript_6638/g.6538 Transcript_6638/m.6538 type:complete len:217 (+) Transcript_6638:50-700(+)